MPTFAASILDSASLASDCPAGSVASEGGCKPDCGALVTASGTILEGKCAPAPAAGASAMPERSILGAIDAVALDEAVAGGMDRIRACWTPTAGNTAGLNGVVTIKFVLGSKGTASSAMVKETTLHDKTVEECVKEVILDLDYPAPRGGMVIAAYPFAFPPK